MTGCIFTAKPRAQGESIAWCQTHDCPADECQETTVKPDAPVMSGNDGPAALGVLPVSDIRRNLVLSKGVVSVYAPHHPRLSDYALLIERMRAAVFFDGKKWQDTLSPQAELLEEAANIIEKLATIVDGCHCQSHPKVTEKTRPQTP